MEPIVFKNSKKRIIFFALISAIFVAAGIWIVSTDHTQKAQMIGWLNIAFFGLGELVFIRQLFDDQPRIILSEQGVFDRTLRIGVIDWEDILAAEVVRIRSTAFIALELADDEKYMSRVPGWSRNLAGANTMLGFQRINLNLSGLDADAEELAQTIVARAATKRQFGA